METHWQEINNYVINRAKTLLSTTNSTFVLGAGVSKDANIPDWETLLAKLIPTKDTVFRPTDYKAITQPRLPSKATELLPAHGVRLPT